MALLIGLNTTLLIAIALLHFYWVLGGQWALAGAIPEKFKETFFNPKYKTYHLLATLAVTLGLLLFAVIISSNYFDWNHIIQPKWTLWGTRIIGSIFLLRAIGDFNICGIFRKSSDSLFARNDKKFYVPLCLILGISAWLISFL